jgi:hypothetical protein
MAQPCTDLEERRRLCFALALKDGMAVAFATLRRRLLALPLVRFFADLHRHA